MPRQTRQPDPDQGTTRTERILVVSCLLMLAAAAMFFFYEPISKFTAAMLTSQDSLVVRSSADSLATEEQQRLAEQGRIYNAALADGTLTVRTESGEIMPYDEQVSWRVPNAMGYIEIEKLGIRATVFHGVENEALSSGVGHLPESSLPLDGEGVHAVLTGHSGSHGNAPFDDIDKLEEGDVFVVWTVNEPHAYQVTGKSVVDPDDGHELAIVPGENLCTLVTCTPKNVNSHRLLVHARACGMPDGPESPISDDAVAVVLCALAAILLGSACAVNIEKRRSHPSGR